MAEASNLHAAVILNNNEDMRAITELLFANVQRRIHLTRYYNFAKEIDLKHAPDVLLVNSLESIAEIVIHFRQNQHPIPPIIHLAKPEVLQYSNYEARFPSVTVFPIEQGSLDEQDVTLRYDLFAKAIDDAYFMKNRTTAPA